MTRAPRGLSLPVLLAVAAALAGLSLLGPSQPSYDPWAWLLWGREVAGGGLDTAEGPAFKPLAVAVTTVLAPLGDAAPAAWLWIARASALLALGLAARVAWGLGGGPAGAALAVAGVALSAGWAWHGAVGNAEGLTLALGLLAIDSALRGSPRAALALGAAAALLRPEAWPLVLAAGAWLAPPGARRALGAVAVLVPLAWLVPEWLGSGDPLRSGARAQVPNPGQPATAAVPALASLRAALDVVLAPLLLAAALAGLLARGPIRLVALLGAAWVAEVALMAQLAGTSGEPRYALPGAGLLAVAGAAWIGTRVGEARGHAAARGRALGRWAGPALAAAVVVAGVLEVDRARGELRRAADEAELYAGLPEAVRRAGGPAAVLACGTPVTGRYRGPAVAYALGVPKRAVGFDPARAGVLLRSRIRRWAPVQPPAPPSARVLARSARWELAVPGPAGRAGC